MFVREKLTHPMVRGGVSSHSEPNVIMATSTTHLRYTRKHNYGNEPNIITSVGMLPGSCLGHYFCIFFVI